MNPNLLRKLFPTVRLRSLIDRLARTVITVGGLATIVSILGIFFFLFREVTPLFTAPSAKLSQRLIVPALLEDAGPALTVAEVDALFSKSRRQGSLIDVTRWGQLGHTGDWAPAPISLYGRNSASGTYGFFKEHALKNGDFKDQVKEQPGSASVVQGISEDRYGIGYSGIGYSTSGVKMVPLAAKAGQPFIEPTHANTKNGTYPLWRYLYIYVNQAPGKPLSPIVKEFLTYVYSKEGQSDVLRDGYFPVDAKLAEQQLGKIR